MLTCDYQSLYMIGGIPYIKEEVRTTSQALPAQYVLKLCETINGINRNLTMDIWLILLDLAERLLEKKLAMIGTLGKNNPEISYDLLKKKTPASDFVYTTDSTLVSFSSKKANLYYSFLSTCHPYGNVDAASNKPEIVLNYNSTKCGVDTYDQLCHSRTFVRKTFFIEYFTQQRTMLSLYIIVVVL